MTKLDYRTLRSRDAKRDIPAELLESVRQMKLDELRVVHVPAKAARERTELSQSEFAMLLGVSVRTLQGWAKCRTQPSGAARTLLAIAPRSPQALPDVAAFPEQDLKRFCAACCDSVGSQ